MLSYAEIDKAASDLYQAELKRQQIDPITLLHPNITMDDAYQIQTAWVDKKIQRGSKVIGYKIGLTSKVMQLAMNIDTPDYGVLLSDMLFSNNSDIATDHFTDPQIEVEFAFVLKKPLYGDNVTVEQVLDATDYIVPALELIAARSYRIHPQTNYRRKVFDTIADNAANAGIIVGSNKIAGADVQSGLVDLRWSGAILMKNGEIEQTGLAAAVLNHPANGICWVAKRFAAHGIGLESGQIILSGSFTAPVKVAVGDRIVADYGVLGTINANFV